MGIRESTKDHSFSISFLSFYFQSLKCRVGNQQADDRFQRALQTCRRQYSSQNKEGEDSDYSSEDENNNESWNLDVFEKNLFINSGNKLLNTQSDKW